MMCFVIGVTYVEDNVMHHVQPGVDAIEGAISRGYGLAFWIWIMTDPNVITCNVINIG